MLRTGVYLGEAHNAIILVCCAGDLRILAVIVETEYPRLVLDENKASSSKFDPGNPRALADTYINA